MADGLILTHVRLISLNGYGESGSIYLKPDEVVVAALPVNAPTWEERHRGQSLLALVVRS